MLNLSGHKFDHEIDMDKLYAMKLINSYGAGNKLIVRWLGGICSGLFLSLFLPWQQNIEGTGLVTAFSPQQRPQTVQTLIDGRIEKWNIREGQFVKKGDTILVISEIKDKFLDPQMLDKLNSQIDSKESSIKSKEDKVRALDNQLLALRTGLKFSLDKAHNKVQQARLYVTIDSVELTAAKADNDISLNQLERQQKLFDQGLVSLTNLEQRSLKYQQTNAKYISAYNKFSAAKNDFLNAEIELKSINAEYMDKISKVESDKNTTQADMFDSRATVYKQKLEYTNMEIRHDMYIIRAPQDGYVVKAIKQGLGETVKEGDEIVTIMPDSPNLAVELYIKPMDMPLIHKGCKVRLQFDGWPSVVFAGWPGASVGTFGGRVEVIDYINSKNGKFRLLVVPDSTDKPWPELIRMGTGAKGWAMLNDVLVGYEIWRRFNGFPPDFTSNNTFYKLSSDKKAEKKEKEETDN